MIEVHNHKRDEAFDVDTLNTNINADTTVTAAARRPTQ